jgi:predicted outer membrane repeat protein
MMPRTHTVRLVGRIAFLFVVLLFTRTPAHANQTTYYVDVNCGDDTWSGLSDVCAAPDGPRKTIQSAIDLTVAGDTVRLADGLYRTSGTPLTFRGKDITLKSANGPANCVIEGQSLGGAIEMNSGETTKAMLAGLTLRQHRLGWPRRGAGVSVIDSGLSIDGCIFSDNQATYGGAINADNATVIITDCEFVRNWAYDNECLAGGGAISGRNSRLSIVRSVFNENRTTHDLCPTVSGTVQGGATHFVECDTTIKDSVFRANFVVGDVGKGGAVHADSGRLVVSGCIFDANMIVGAGALGGAVHVDSLDVTIENCIFVRNRIQASLNDFGGAIYGNGNIRVTGSTFTHNIGPEQGGAIALRSMDSMVINSAFYRNTSKQASAIALFDGRLGVQYSYFENGVSSVSGPATWGAGNILTGDPGFVSPRVNQRLKRNSPLIDAGDSFAVTIPPLPAVALDLDGNPRLQDDPGTPDTGIAPAGVAVVDIGAYEFQGSSCEADCDWSTGPGVLDVFDFLCFQNAFVAADPYACDCDTSTGVGVCDIKDFLCFQSAFVAGCP